MNHKWSLTLADHSPKEGEERCLKKLKVNEKKREKVHVIQTKHHRNLKEETNTGPS